MRSHLAVLGRSVAMVFAALVLAMLIFTLCGYSAGDVATAVVEGAITAPGAWQNTLRWTIPLVLVSCGVIVSFRAGYFNVGAQGQLYLGAIAGYAVAAMVPGPRPVVIALALVAAAVAGMAWALIAAFLKQAFGTDETLATLMLNYIGILALQYAATGPLRDQAGTGQVAASPPLPVDTRISGSSGLSVTIVVIVVVVAFGTWLLLTRTRFGLSATLAGRNAEMMRWQGARGSSVAIASFGLAGATAGLAGAVEVAGPGGRLIAAFSPDLGFTAVLVALVGSLSVGGAVIAALFFGGLQAAMQYLPLVSDLPTSASPLLQGMIALAITAHIGVRKGWWASLRQWVRERTHSRGEEAAGPQSAPTSGAAS